MQKKSNDIAGILEINYNKRNKKSKLPYVSKNKEITNNLDTNSEAWGPYVSWVLAKYRWARFGVDFVMVSFYLNVQSVQRSPCVNGKVFSKNKINRSIRILGMKRFKRCKTDETDIGLQTTCISNSPFVIFFDLSIVQLVIFFVINVIPQLLILIIKSYH